MIIAKFNVYLQQIFGEFMKPNKIKDVLDSKGISQTWLAKQLGKSFSTVNCYARNKYQPDLETWTNCEICGTMSHIFGQI